MYNTINSKHTLYIYKHFWDSRNEVYQSGKVKEISLR